LGGVGGAEEETAAAHVASADKGSGDRGALEERRAEAEVASGDRDLGEAEEALAGDRLVRIDEACAVGDDEGAGDAARGAGEGAGIGELAAKIESAHEAHDLADAGLAGGEPAGPARGHYLAILDLGVLGVAFFRRWRALDVIALVGTWALFAGWLASAGAVEIAAAPVVAWTATFFAIFLLAPFAYHLRRRAPMGIDRFLAEIGWDRDCR
jgi:hypothetical protein